MKSSQELVSESAKLLDTEAPGWFRIINQSQLDMLNGRDCIVGQLTASGKYPTARWNDIDESRGFVGHHIPSLRAAWVNEINSRLLTGGEALI